MFELYHYAISTCSQKTRMVLAEKGVEFVSHEVDLAIGGQHDPEYVKLNPNHVVPTLIHDGHVIIESTRIIQYLDDLIPEPPMRPKDALGRYRVSKWLDYIDHEIHRDAPTLTFGIGAREIMLQLPDDLRQANIDQIPDRFQRETRQSVMDHGVNAPEMQAAYLQYIHMLDMMEADLVDSPWLSGDTFGLADATVAPYALRLEDIAFEGLYSKARRPLVHDWFQRVQARDCWEIGVRKWQVPELQQLFREQGRTAFPLLEKIAS